MQTPLISVKQLSRHYGKFRAVDNLNFELHRGQILGFLGVNGAGKTTTMQLITGNLAPTTGEIQIAGHDLFNDAHAAKQAIGYLPEHLPLYKEMTVNEYLRFCAELHRVAKTEISHALQDTLARCGLEQVQNRLIHTLSKGYQQRIGIAQAIIHAPEVVILDEPTVGLDPVQIHEIRQLIKQLGEKHSVLISTHLLSEVQSICTDVQLIHRGQLKVKANLGELLAQMSTQVAKIGLRRPPHESAFQTITGIKVIETLKEGYFKIQYQTERQLEQLVNVSVQENWGIFALIPESSSLEQWFIEMTQD